MGAMARGGRRFRGRKSQTIAPKDIDKSRKADVDSTATFATVGVAATGRRKKIGCIIILVDFRV